MSRNKTRMQVESLEARQMLSANPVSEVLCPLPEPEEVKLEGHDAEPLPSTEETGELGELVTTVVMPDDGQPTEVCDEIPRPAPVLEDVAVSAEILEVQTLSTSGEEAELSILPFPFAATVYLQKNGVLLIQGTHRADAVFVERDGDKVVVNYSTSPPPGMMMPTVMLTREFDASQVELIVFRGRGGNDVFENHTDIRALAYGGRGADRLLGGDANDLIFGGRGRDSITGGLGSDFLLGGAGADELDGTGDESTFDLLLGGLGADLLLGDENDWLVEGTHHILPTPIPMPMPDPIPVGV